MTYGRHVSRRGFLCSGLGTIGLGLLAACAPQAPATSPTAQPAAPAKPAEAPKPAEAVKPPEAAKPAAPAATTAPAAATKPAEAAKPAAAPAQPAAAAKPADQQLGRHLIGQMEGPTIITDPAQFPKTFKEAPALADLVKAGKLPPLQERIGQDPLVLKPLHEIGKYGGTWRRGFTGPADQWNGVRAGGHDTVLWRDYSATKIVPNIARGWEVQDNGRTLLLFLRRGMKWSDGQPFTADDFMFWYEDMLQNKDLVKLTPIEMAINGKPVVMEKVDASTVRYRFADPYFLFVDLLAGSGPGAGPAQYGRDFQGGYAPAHYMKQFHPKYVDPAKLDQMARESKFDNWVNLFKARIDWAINPEVPTVTAWKPVTAANTPSWVLERNPYSIWVDTEGNQLPYIDKIQLTLAENLEVLNLRAIAGEYDYQERHVDVSKLPVLLENQQKGGYKVYLDPGDFGSDVHLSYNMSFEKDPEIARWISNVDFRRALALGVDRDQLNEAFWLGLGTPGSGVPGDSNPYSPGPEYRTLWHVNDPDKANQMLDAIGLKEKDGEGYRLRTDGGGRLRIEVMTLGGQRMPYTQISEMIRQHWKRIGIDIVVNEVERSLAITRIQGNDHQILAWANDTTEVLIPSIHVLPVSVGSFERSPLYARWYVSNGSAGKEPPARMKEAYEMWRTAYGVPEEERLRLGKEIWKIAIEDVWHIGIVGLSPADSGVRVVKTTMGNVPAREFNSNIVRKPGGSRPETLFWKS